MKKEVICSDIEGNKFNVPVSELSFRPSVYAVIIENGKILLSKQWDGYDFPGGGMDIGETIEEALKREVMEETGIEIEISKVVDCENSFFKLPFAGNNVHSILMYFLCKNIGGILTTDNFDENEKKYADMPEWIDLNDINDIKFHNPVDSLKIIKDAIKLQGMK
ncbi:MAG: NUDIX domain-containing protein [Candidatus Moranbacteria bacterium]|nr:NUDIX domain-containing protein [Candidatus Moranbacteria bacterium]